MAAHEAGDFGRALKRYRLAAGLSQEALAARARLSPRGIQDLERGVNRAPRKATIDLLAEALELPAQDRAALDGAAVRRRDCRKPRPLPAANHLHNVPAQLTPFIGREQATAEVGELVRREHVRLLTLTGPGGIGKTRLAVQAATELIDDFADGVFLIALAPVSDPAVVGSTIAQVLGVKETAGTSLVEALTAYLRDKQVLLLLDNFEHVAGAAVLMVDLLAACPRLQVVATSRAVLRVQGERTFPVPPLTLPAPAGVLDHGCLMQYEAVRLFVAHAQAARPDFQLTQTTGPVVAQICRRLEGVPLALELAAARLRLLSPQALLARLEQRLPMLTGGTRDRPERQRALRNTIAWSYDLLTQAEQALFCRVAVFEGGWTLEAAETVCAAPAFAEIAVVDGLAALVDNSLVQVEEQADGEMRFTMLDTVREYGLEWLAASGETEALQRQQAAYFLALAETAEPALRGPQQALWLARLETEHDNLRAVLRWAQARGALELGVRLAVALGPFWQLRDHDREGRHWLEGFLAQAGSAALPASLRARAFSRAGALATNLWDIGGAEELLARGRALAGDLRAQRDLSTACANLGYLLRACGDYERATALFADGVARARELGDKALIADALTRLGLVQQEQGDHGQARALHEESLALFRELEDPEGRAICLRHLGELAHDERAYAQAMALYEDSLRVWRAMGARWQIAYTLLDLGAAAGAQGAYGRAAAALAESRTLFGALEDDWGSAYTLSVLGDVARAEGDVRSALQLYTQSLSMLRRLHLWGSRYGLAGCLEGLASVLCTLGQPQRAVGLFGAAAALRAAVGLPQPPAKRATCERDVAGARAAVGDEAFAAAWAAGQELSLEQAIAAALGTDVHPPALSAPVPEEMHYHIG